MILWGFILHFQKIKKTSLIEEFCRIGAFDVEYPDDSLRIDINDFLKYAKDIRLHTELIINAEDFLMEENYKMSIIEADIAIESIIYSILEKFYRPVTMDTQVREVFLKELLKNRIDEVVEKIIIGNYSRMVKRN